MLQPRELAMRLMAILDEKQAGDMLLLSVNHLTVIADYFIICSGRSSVQVRTLCDEVDEQMSKEGLPPTRIDGVQEARWVVLDFGSVIVHIFGEQEREYYRLERLWMDGSNAIQYPEE